MHGYDVHEILYLSCEIHCPSVRGSGLRRGGGKYGHIVLIHFIFLNLLLNSYTSVKINDIIMLTRKISTKIVNFMSHGVWALTLGQDKIGYIVLMHTMFKSYLLYSNTPVGKPKFLIL